jgi:hypothetical protein
VLAHLRGDQAASLNIFLFLLMPIAQYFIVLDPSQQPSIQEPPHGHTIMPLV